MLFLGWWFKPPWWRRTADVKDVCEIPLGAPKIENHLYDGFLFFLLFAQRDSNPEGHQAKETALYAVFRLMVQATLGGAERQTSMTSVKSLWAHHKTIGLSLWQRVPFGGAKINSHELSRIVSMASSFPVYNFFQELIRRVNIFEHPLVTARGDGKSYIYANYNPKYAQYFATIFRTFYIFCWV